MDEEACAVHCTCTVKVTGKTGVEMEALTGVTTALLTIYDMCKALDKSMEITEVYLVHKTGGQRAERYATKRPKPRSVQGQTEYRRADRKGTEDMGLEKGMKLIRTEDAVGTVLCHDITQIIPGQVKGPVFRKGHVVREEDISGPSLCGQGRTSMCGRSRRGCSTKMRGLKSCARSVRESI